jgi:hypothetical protein
MAAANAAEMRAGNLSDQSYVDMTQAIFKVAGFPTTDCPYWDALVEVRRSASGRQTVAREAIDALTFVRMRKVRLGMTDEEVDSVHGAFSVFVRRAVPELIGYPALFSVLVQQEELPHGSDMCLFVCPFLARCLHGDPMVQQLMDYDAFDAVFVTNTLKRLMIADVLWLHFWREKLEGSIPADTVWAVFSFILTHALINDSKMLTFGPFCLSACPQARLDWYERGSDLSAPPCGDVDEGGVIGPLGNFFEIAPWGRQTHVGDGQIAADECVVFVKAVAAGEAVECDYGESYMLAREVRLTQFHGSEIETLIEAVFRHFDPRVLAAFEAYMALEA